MWRVSGILATSRALGDYPLKERNLVIADPDVLIFDLDKIKPRFMIIASDGLWDAFSNEEAVNYIAERFNEPHFGAKSIVLQAYYRGSLDNITVMVVDLSRGTSSCSSTVDALSDTSSVSSEDELSETRYRPDARRVVARFDSSSSDGARSDEIRSEEFETIFGESPVTATEITVSNREQLPDSGVLEAAVTEGDAIAMTSSQLSVDSQHPEALLPAADVELAEFSAAETEATEGETEKAESKKDSE